MGKLCDIFLTMAVVVLGLCCFFCLIRSIIGPRIADRIVAVNMIGTMTMMMIVILAVKMQEGFLVDVAIIYAMISFLAVVVLVKIYMGVYREKEEKGSSPKENLQEEKTAAQSSFQNKKPSAAECEGK